MVAQKSTSQSTSLIGADWVRWALAILITLLVAANAWVVTYTLGNEHRVTKVETDLASHLEKARDDKREIFSRLDKQDDNITKVLSGINSVQLDMAKLTGYFERAKEPK